MAFTYTNRNGRTYHLHRRETARGTRFVFAREPGEGAIEEIPEGHEVRENVNGVVSLARARPRKIGEDEQRVMVSALAGLGLSEYRVEVKDNAIVVFEPDRSGAEMEQILQHLGLGGGRPMTRAMEVMNRNRRFSPVLRFVLSDRRERVFHAERMTYTGEGGWSWPLDQGSLADLAEDILPHLGKDSFFELM